MRISEVHNFPSSFRNVFPLDVGYLATPRYTRRNLYTEPRMRNSQLHLFLRDGARDLFLCNATPKSENNVFVALPHCILLAQDDICVRFFHTEVIKW